MEEPEPNRSSSQQGVNLTNACSRLTSAAEQDVVSRPMTSQTGSDVSSGEHSLEGMSPVNTCRSGTRPTRCQASSKSRGPWRTKPFGFEKQTAFEAARDLLKSRSDSFILRPPFKDNDIWKRPPPDFRPQVYAPRPPKRNSRDSMKPWKYGTFPGQYKVVHREGTTASLDLCPRVLRPQRQDDCGFLTSFDIPDPYEARLIMCREGLHPKEPYVTPQPHDFRGYPPLKSLGLPEFVTSYERDPYSIQFNTQRLNRIHGLTSSTPTERDIRGRQMAPPMSAQPKYEERLILRREPWPMKSASYTRHRRADRTAHSALMERVEHVLSAQWAREGLVRQLEKCAE